MPRSLPLHVKRVTAKGREYYYYDTGLTAPDKHGRDQKVYVRLPNVRSPDFGVNLAAAQGARTKRHNAQSVMTVARMGALWQRSRDYAATAPATRALYDTYLRQIAALMGNAPAHDVHPPDVERLLDHMQATPGAANAAKRVLSALYAWGRKRGHVGRTVKPTEGVSDIEAGEHAPWPKDALDEALSGDSDTLRLAAHLLYYTAQRIGDVLAMQWSDIRGGRIHVKQGKTGKELTIPMHSALAAELERTPRKGLRIMNGTHPQTVRRHVQALGKRHGVRLVPHGLRKNAVNALLESGCSAPETAAISGQSLRMVEHYAKGRDQTTMASAAILKWERKAG